MKITIFVDGVWAGEGRLVGGNIVDCPAILGGSQDAADDIYEAIEDAIADGDESEARDGDGIKINGVSYAWTVEECGLICGRQVRHDNSGVGHNWRDIDAEAIPPSIREEIEGEMIDGEMDTCDDFVASNGLRYRW